MSALYVDTSSLIKRYVTEIGSNWMRSQLVPSSGNQIIISALSTVEIVSGLVRRQREGTLTLQNRLRIQNNFLWHVENRYTVVALDDPVLKITQNLLAKHLLRSLDALQLAGALQATATLNIPLTFISADLRLLAAAQAEGLQIDNPNNHP